MRALLIVMAVGVLLPGCLPPGRVTSQEELKGACGEPGAPRLDNPQVVFYDSPGDFKKSECVLIRGDVGPMGGCGFTLAHDKPHQAIEVAEEPETCRSLWEVGTP